jgi:predicted ATPase
MLKTVSGRGYRLVGTWAVREPSRSDAIQRDPLQRIAETAAATAFATNLPAAAAPLIGRDAVAAQLADLLSAYRTVTLTGPGGIGKTVLALDVARRVFPGYQGDAWLVELGALSDPGLVPSAVAAALGLKLGSGAISAEAVARSIGGKKLLMVLDNCEHVIDAAARLAETLVQLCPRATILATSRELLRVEGEYAYRVPPLDVPPDQAEPGSILGHGAVALFVARTTAAHASFAPGTEGLLAIAALCRRLDGIPLALEFAAARVTTLGLKEVAARLDDRFGLLTGGRRTALPRHQTLRATLDWSYELLPALEQRVVRRLAMFAGGFAPEAAIAVAGDAGSSEAAVIEAIGNLVAKSLVTLDGGASGLRWRLLETIRAYALEKLQQSGEAAQIARRHAQYFRDLFGGTDADRGDQPIADWHATYQLEIGNVRAALDWAFSAEGDALVGVMLAAGAIPLLYGASLVGECYRRSEQALAAIAAGVKVDLRSEMHLLMALHATRVYTVGPGPAAREAWNRALAIATELGDANYQARALWGLWNDCVYSGSPAASVPFAERYAELAGAGNDAARTVLGRRIIGISLHYCGDQLAAEVHLAHVLSHYAEGWQVLGTKLDHATVTRATMARVHWLRGQPDLARRVTDQAMREAIAQDNPISILYVLVEAAIPLSFLSGDVAAARAYLATMLQLAADTGFRIWHVHGRCFQAMLAAVGGGPVAELHNFRDAIAELRETGFCAHVTMFLAALAEAQGAAGEIADAMRTVDSALDRCKRHEERWFTAELLRIRSAILALQAAGGQPAIPVRDAIDLARRQGALSWELRCAMTLARLSQGRGQVGAARELLAAVYGRFTEGFETADLKAARAMLAALQ